MQLSGREDIFKASIPKSRRMEHVHDEEERSRSSLSMSPMNLSSTIGGGMKQNQYDHQQQMHTSESVHVERKLTSSLNQLNRKILEPLLRDLEMAHSLFSQVNMGTKKALKEFVFLKKKEEVERKEFERMDQEEEELRKQQQILSARERRHSVGHKNALMSNSSQSNSKRSDAQPQINPAMDANAESVSEVTQRPPQIPKITPESQPSKTLIPTTVKKELSVPQNVNKKNQPTTSTKPTLKRDSNSQKQLPNEKKPHSGKSQQLLPNQNSFKDPTKKKTDLDNILAMARKIRNYEETKAFENIVNKKIESKENSSSLQQENEHQEKEQKHVKFSESLPQQDPTVNVNLKAPQKPPQVSKEEAKTERKLSFITMSERFEHYVDFLQRIQQLNEKAEQIGGLFEKKTGWKFYTPKQISKGSTKFAPEIPLTDIYNKTLTSVLSTAQSKTWSITDIQDFQERFIFDENDMNNIEAMLLKNTKEVRTPELTPTSTVYSDIPNSYVGRWLPKRVDPRVIDLLVPRKSLKFKLDKKRAKYSTPILYYQKENELKIIAEHRFKVQHLMLKRYLYGKLFKDHRLLDLLPHIQQQGNDSLYYNLLRALEGIIPCEAIRDENRRTIIHWKSMFHFVERPHYEEDDFFNDFTSSSAAHRQQHHSMNSEQEQDIEEDCHHATVRDHDSPTRTLTPLDLVQGNHFHNHEDVNSPSSFTNDDELDQHTTIEEQIHTLQQRQQHDDEEEELADDYERS
ncbi:hypothetical protein C9374_004992 [Naegleria lovaniensis]|uniref:Uncharacterized protein n=1 Tax=Naegleria lovaniensis TaxID=51637 RepID=A0AA88GS07_NAELO|nr:uncharacterized protein C9374_004992 [Naegleria lovaniensis]KAG2383025.1 hypothetical protein C9374_004992 [Naegleria lovaniensis]